MSKFVDLSWTNVVSKGNDFVKTTASKWISSQPKAVKPKTTTETKSQFVSTVPPLPFTPTTKERFLDTETKLHILKCMGEEVCC